MPDLDPYEANIRPPGTVLHRDKSVARTPILAMAPMALLALLVTVLVASGADAAAPRAMAVLPGLWFLGTLWLMLTKVSVRTVLTTERLEVHWGLGGPKVALSAITHCSATPPLTTGLPPVRFAVNGWAPKGWVVIRWRDEKGKERAAQFPADDPPRLVEEIERARARVGARLRVEDAASRGIEDVVETAGDEAASRRAERR